MTQEFLQDTMVADLKELFSHERLKNSLGVEREIQIYPQDVPIRRGDDEAIDKEAPPEPYVVVRLLVLGFIVAFPDRHILGVDLDLPLDAQGTFQPLMGEKLL